VPVGPSGANATSNLTGPSEELFIGGVWPENGYITIDYMGRAATPGQSLQMGTSLRIYTKTGPWDGRSVADGGDFVPDGYTFQIADAALHTVYLVGNQGTPVSMGGFRVEGMQYGMAATPQTIKVTLKAPVDGGPQLTPLCYDAVITNPLPNVIIMSGVDGYLPGVGDTACVKQMEDIGRRMLSDLRRTWQETSICIAVERATDAVYDEIRRIADFNAQEYALRQAESPFIMAGFSDGATEIRNFAFQLRWVDYRDELIDYVGMIDLAREDVNLSQDPWNSLPNYLDTELDMPDSILKGDNYYERSLLWGVAGHRLVQAVEWQTIDNVDLTSARCKHPGHFDLPRMVSIRDMIALNAVEAYVQSPARRAARRAARGY
jgi:hypothetical protein